MLPVIGPTLKRKHLLGLIAEWDPGRQVKEGTTGQSLIDYSNKQNPAQLGSAAGADTNDPTWTSTGLSFGADDYCKKTKGPPFDDMTTFTVITACKSNSLGGANGGRLWDKQQHNFSANVGNKLRYYRTRGTGSDQWLSSSAFSVGSDQIYGISFNRLTPDIAPAIWISANKSAVTNVGGGSGTVVTDTSNDLFIGNAASADRFWDGTIYYQAWYNRVLSDAEYLREYRRIKAMLANRGITI